MLLVIILLTAKARRDYGFRIPEKARDIFFRVMAGIRDNPFEAIHLPEVPGYNLCNLSCLFFSRSDCEFVSVVIRKRV